MKKTFKKLLKPVLTAALALSLLSVMNVSTFAAINTESVDSSTTTVYSFFGEEAKTLTEVTATVGSGTASYLSSGAGTYIGTAYTSDNTNLAFTADTSSIAPKFNAVDAVSGKAHLEIPANAGDTIYVYGCYNNSGTVTSTLLFLPSTTVPIDTTDYAVDVSTERRVVSEASYTVPDDFDGDTIYIIAYGSNNFDIAAVAVVSGSSTSLSLDTTAVSLEPGDTATVTATAKNAGTPTISWESSDEAVATVSAATGDSVTITGVADGTATVTASFEYESKTYEKTVTVTVATKVNFASTFDASGYSAGNILIDTLTSDKLFKIMPAPSNSSSYVAFASSNSGDITLADGTSYSSSIALATRGGGTYAQRSIGFKTGDTAGTIYYYAKSGSTSTTDTISVVLSDGTAPTGVTVTNGTDAVVGTSGVTEIKITGLAANTEYYICGAASTYIYYVASTETLAAFDALPTVDFDTYTVTGTDGTVYYIAGLASTVDEDTLATYESCYLKGATPETAITTVYTGVSVDGLEIEAEKFGYSYVYGFVVSGASAGDDLSGLSTTYVLTATTEG